MKKTKMTGFLMFVLSVVCGIVDASGMLAATVIPTNTTNGPKAGIGLVGGAPGNMTEGQIRTELKTAAGADPAFDPDEFYADSVDKEIVKFRPDLSPLDTITRQMKAKKADTMRFNWYSVDVLPNTATVTSAPTDNRNVIPATALVEVSDVKLFHPTDTIRIVDAAGAEHVLFVLSVESANSQLTCVVPYDQEVTTAGNVDVATYIASIAANDTIYIMGRAAAEGDMQTDAYGIVPTKQNNFCQIFKCQVSESTIQKLSRKDLNWSLSDVEEQAIYEWRNNIEMSALFGKKAFFHNGNKNADVYMTNGIVNYINKTLTLGTAGVISEADLVDSLLKPIFVGNAGSQQRVMFAGSDFIAAISKIPSIQKQQEAGNTVVVWGIEWKEIRSNFGTLLLQHHKGLDRNGYADKAIVLDMQYVDKWTFQSLKRDEIDTKKAGTYDGDTYVTTEMSGFALRYPDCHAIVKLG